MSAGDPFLQRVMGIFQASGSHLVWERLPDDHVLGAESGEPIESDKAYFTVRLTEMFLGKSRTLWRKFYPVVHSFSAYGEIQEHSIAGPGQLQAVTDAGLDRVVTLNFRLAGPTPFRGGDVSVVAGLYSVPGDDAARALVETVSAVSALAVPPYNQIGPIVDVVKNGIDSIFQLSTTTLRLGVNDTFVASNPLRSGFYVGIGASVNDIDRSSLWLSNGHLLQGKDPVAARAFNGYDYMVIQMERGRRLPTWSGLPGMTEQQNRFNAILADDLLSAGEKRKRLAKLWPGFREALQTSAQLTKTDAGLIENDVAQDLSARLDAQEHGNPFETKSWDSGAVVTQSATSMDFADVAEYELPGDPGQVPAFAR